MAKQPKRIKAWTGDRDAAHSVEAAIALVKANAKAKFDESVEISVNLGVDPRHADQQVRGVMTLLDAPTLMTTNISSTKIRERIKKGFSIDEFVPSSVAAYIKEHGVYMI